MIQEHNTPHSQTGVSFLRTYTPPTTIVEVRDIACIDTDGDGFGWTGGDSCIVEADGSITIRMLSI